MHLLFRLSNSGARRGSPGRPCRSPGLLDDWLGVRPPEAPPLIPPAPSQGVWDFNSGKLGARGHRGPVSTRPGRGSGAGRPSGAASLRPQQLLPNRSAQTWGRFTPPLTPRVPGRGFQPQNPRQGRALKQNENREKAVREPCLPQRAAERVPGTAGRGHQRGSWAPPGGSCLARHQPIHHQVAEKLWEL